MTIGALTASALSMTAEAGLKSVVGEAVKDAYQGLKSLVGQWASADVEALEKTPGSIGRKQMVAELVDERPVEDQAEARALAERLIAALKGSRPIGLDIGRLETLEVQLGSIEVTDGVGVRIAEAKIGGAFTTGDIKVGAAQKKTLK